MDELATCRLEWQFRLRHDRSFAMEGVIVTNGLVNSAQRRRPAKLTQQGSSRAPAWSPGLLAAQPSMVRHRYVQFS